MKEDISALRCTVQSKGYRFCDLPSADWTPFPICAYHARKLYEAANGLLGGGSELSHLAATVEAAKILQQRRMANLAADGIVYYLQVGALIKIGFTANLRQRLSDYPPDTRTLATEPGNRSTEAMRHRQFANLRSHRSEWYQPGPDLLEHIKTLGMET